MSASDDKLLDLLEAGMGGDPPLDIGATGELNFVDAYRLQLAWKRRRERDGDPIVGYRLSLTSRGAVKEAERLGFLSELTALSAGIAPPVMTTLSQSNLGTSDTIVEVQPGNAGFVEAEVGVLVGERLQGPGVTALAAARAIAGFLPTIDLAQWPLSPRYGMIHTMATSATQVDTTIVCGDRLTPPPVDLPLEGILVSINGEPRAATTAWECMGNPINAVVWLANHLARFNTALEPGQLVVTGACPPPQRLIAGDLTARADFRSLGGVSVRVHVPPTEVTPGD
ncbi:2-keto-4-pentenoate hydratase [Mycolicibacterium sp. CBM1]